MFFYAASTPFHGHVSSSAEILVSRLKCHEKPESMKTGISTRFTSTNQPKRESISKGMVEWHKQNKYKDALYKALVRENLIEKMIEQLVLSLADKKTKPKDKAAIILAILKLLSPTDKSQSVPSVKVSINQ